MKATPEEVEKFKKELENLTLDINPVLMPFMVVEMLGVFDKVENTKEFIDIIKEKYCYKELHELVDKAENRDTFEFYKEVYNLGMKNSINKVFPSISDLVERTKKLSDDLEELYKKNKQIVDKACKWLEEILFDGHINSGMDKTTLLQELRKAMEE